MKTKEQKYREAVTRNITSLKSAMPALSPRSQKKYRDAMLAECKMMLGIRKNDDQWDGMILDLREKCIT